MHGDRHGGATSTSVTGGQPRGQGFHDPGPAAGFRDGVRAPGPADFVAWQRGREHGFRGGDGHAMRTLEPVDRSLMSQRMSVTPPPGRRDACHSNRSAPQRLDPALVPIRVRAATPSLGSRQSEGIDRQPPSKSLALTAHPTKPPGTGPRPGRRQPDPDDGHTRACGDAG